MFKNILQAVKKIFTGESLEERCQAWVESHNPQSVHEAETLQRQFWIALARRQMY
jgi:hypothetical protein